MAQHKTGFLVLFYIALLIMIARVGSSVISLGNTVPPGYLRPKGEKYNIEQ